VGAAASVLGLLAVLLAPAQRQQTKRKTLIAMFAIVAPLLLMHAAEQFDPDASTPSSDMLDSQPFSEAALAQARAANRPVFLYFTADWCLTCKVNESVAIETRASAQALDAADAVVLRGDWTRRDPAITAFLTQQGVAGVPLYLWYAPGAREPQRLPQVLTPQVLPDLATASAQRDDSSR